MATNLSEPEILNTYGRHWFAYIYGSNDTEVTSVVTADGSRIGELSVAEARKQLTDAVNELPLLQENDMRLTRGWQSYDPVVEIVHEGKRGKKYRYVTMVGEIAGEDDGGAQSAARLLAWMDGGLSLAELSPVLKAFAVITHLSEVGRGYEATLDTQLRTWLQQIAERGADSRGAAELWKEVNKKFHPSLTFKQDTTGPTAWQ